MTTTLLQTGIYTISEAWRLTGVSPWRIRRWVRGYEFKVKHGRHRSPAVWSTQLEQIDHTVALGFLDLLEVRCVGAFVSAGERQDDQQLAMVLAEKAAAYKTKSPLKIRRNGSRH